MDAGQAVARILAIGFRYRMIGRTDEKEAMKALVLFVNYESEMNETQKSTILPIVKELARALIETYGKDNLNSEAKKAIMKIMLSN